MFIKKSPFPRNYQYSHPLAGKSYNNNKFLECSQIDD